MNRIIPYILLPFILFTLSGCSEEEPAPRAEVAKPVKTMTIGAADDLEHREFPGKVRASKDVELSFQVPGQIIEFPIKKGAEIKQNTLIARLDPTDYKIRVQEAKASRDERKMAFDRAEGLLPDGFISQSDYDRIKSEFQIAEANLAEAEQNLKYTAIYAPFAGRVADTYPEIYQYVNAKQPIAFLQDINEIDILIDVPESLLIRMEDTEIKKQVAVFEASPTKEYKVAYRKHIEIADPATQTYRVYMGMQQPKDLTVLPGMTATVKIEYKQSGDKSRANAFLVPSSAVFADEHGKQFVWLIDSNTSRVKKNAVTVGDITHNDILITSGLKTGDTIVTAGVHFLIPDQLVTNINDAK